jgi:hypothetical protein
LKHYILWPKDVPRNVYLFRRMDSSSRRLVLKDRYKDLACQTCGKIDERLALERGLEDDVIFRFKTDLFCSFELLYILSQRAKGVLDSFPGVSVRYFPIPSCQEHFVVLPERVYEPGKGRYTKDVCPSSTVTVFHRRV